MKTALGGPVPQATTRPAPPPEEQAFGMRAYLSDAPGISGRLRTESEDFQVVEVGDDPPRRDGPFTAARVRLRNWETNRFAGRAAKELHIKRGHAGFAGMKDKRAVTEQWFTFRCPPDRLAALERLQDVELVGAPYSTDQKQYAGAHAGNRFVLRVRGSSADADAIAATRDAIASEGGVPNFFGPQRFGSSVRPVTPLMGKAIVAGDLEEAVRLYVGHPYDSEPDAARDARRIYDEARDAEATLAAMPERLDFERSILQRLVKKPGDWRHALMALPHNLLQLFVHSYQSLLWNDIVSTRIETGLGLSTAHLGDRVMAHGEDGTRTVPVTEANQERVQREIDRGRASPTAPLIGLDVPMCEGVPGENERQVLEAAGVDVPSFRCRELPQVASPGRRRAILLPVRALEVSEVDGDPVFAFRLDRGAYATVVMREFLKAPVDAY